MNKFFSIAAFVAASIARIARVRWARNGLAAVGLVAAVSSPAFAGYYMFGQSTITVPANTAAGTVVARDYITMQQMCNATQCPVANLALFNYGGATRVTGPDVLTTVTGLTTRIIINGQAATSGLKTTVTGPVEVQLVATGQTIIPGSLKASGQTLSPAYFIFNENASNQYQVFLAATVQVINGTCSVPSQTVMLPTVSLAKFSGVGSSQGTQSFNISLTNCPPGFNRVGYSLLPVGSEVTVPGALPLSTGSTATGVRIRIAGTTGSPVTFSTSIALSTYSKASGGSYSVPYQASYVQTAASVTPGTVSGSMQVLVDYQ